MDIVKISEMNIVRISDGVNGIFSSWMPNYRYLPETKITLWDKKRTKMGFPPDCCCIEEIVSEFFPIWLKKRKNVDSSYKDIIDLHYGLRKGLKMSERGKLFIQEFLAYLMEDENSYPLLYLEAKCKLTTHEASVVLAYLCREGYTNHGASVRGSYPIEKGRELVRELKDWKKRGEEKEENYLNLVKPWNYEGEIPEGVEIQKKQITNYWESLIIKEEKGEEIVPKLLEDI